MTAYRSSDLFSTAWLLAKWLANFRLRLANELIEPRERRMNHCKAGLARMVPNPLHLQASFTLLEAVTVSMCFLYNSIC